MTFFERQLQLRQCAPDGGERDLRGEFGAQFFKRGVRAHGHQLAQVIALIAQFGFASHVTFYQSLMSRLL